MCGVPSPVQNDHSCVLILPTHREAHRAVTTNLCPGRDGHDACARQPRLGQALGMNALYRRLDLSDAKPPSVAARLATAVDDALVTHVVGLGFGLADQECWRAIAAAMGDIRLSETVAAGRPRRWPVLPPPEPTDIASTFVTTPALGRTLVDEPLHAAGADDSATPDLVLIGMPVGTILRHGIVFADAGCIAATAEMSVPRLWAQLTNLPLRFARLDGGGHLTPVFRGGPGGWTITWDPSYIVDGGDPLVRRLISEFGHFLDHHIVAAGRAGMAVMAPGDALLIHNARALHGLQSPAMVAESGSGVWRWALRRHDVPIGVTP